MEIERNILVFKAVFPFSLILKVFKLMEKADVVAMINPFTKRIITTNTKLSNGVKVYLIPYNMYWHELKHVEQVKAHGSIIFILKYLYYNVRYGYHNNPFEIDARRASILMRIK